MFGIHQSELPLVTLIIALAVWYYVFERNKQFSIRSLLILMAIIAVWLALFQPWKPVFF
jgi:hypothetical protein